MRAFSTRDQDKTETLDEVRSLFQAVARAMWRSPGWIAPMPPIEHPTSEGHASPGYSRRETPPCRATPVSRLAFRKRVLSQRRPIPATDRHADDDTVLSWHSKASS